MSAAPEPSLDLPPADVIAGWLEVLRQGGQPVPIYTTAEVHPAYHRAWWAGVHTPADGRKGCDECTRTNRWTPWPCMAHKAHRLALEQYLAESTAP